MARFLNDCPGIKALELNISCPNVHKGGFHYNKDPRDTFTITEETKKASTRRLLWVKLSPNVTDIREFAKPAKALEPTRSPSSIRLSAWQSIPRKDGLDCACAPAGFRDRPSSRSR